jgi:alpha-beta hydrolase superfamily lysophospholipase
MDEQTVVDAHGVDVYSRWWTIDAPRGVVVIAHGASEHAGRYDRFARALNDAGFTAVAIDHRALARVAPRAVGADYRCFQVVVNALPLAVSRETVAYVTPLADSVTAPLSHCRPEIELVCPATSVILMPV